MLGPDGPSMKQYIVIAGNIGVGKSTLVSLVAERLGFQPHFEPVLENPYLADFYADMEKWALQSQLYFLTHRVRSHRELMRSASSVAQDRSIYEDAGIFARNLYQQGRMSERDWRTYSELYETVVDLLPPPDLVVYLRASVDTLRRRIERRGRAMEADIPEAYLAGLNRLYEEWIDGFRLAPVQVVPCDRLDFVAEPRDLDAIVDRIACRLRSCQGELFPVGM
jgi:deoxyadenosine/deoxycytidine kinase